MYTRCRIEILLHKIKLLTFIIFKSKQCLRAPGLKGGLPEKCIYYGLLQVNWVFFFVADGFVIVV